MDKSLITWVPLVVMVVTLVMKYVSDQSMAKKDELVGLQKQIDELKLAERLCSDRVTSLQRENYDLMLRLVGMVPTNTRDIVNASVKLTE